MHTNHRGTKGTTCLKKRGFILWQFTAKRLQNTYLIIKWRISTKRQDDFKQTNINPMKERWSQETLPIFALVGGISRPNEQEADESCDHS